MHREKNGGQVYICTNISDLIIIIRRRRSRRPTLFALSAQSSGALANMTIGISTIIPDRHQHHRHQHHHAPSTSAPSRTCLLAMRNHTSRNENRAPAPPRMQLRMMTYLTYLSQPPSCTALTVICSNGLPSLWQVGIWPRWT